MELTVKKFLLKKYPTNEYMDCPVPKHHWEVMQEYAELYHTQKLEESEKDLQKEFLMPAYENGDTANKGFNDGIETHREIALPIIASLKRDVEKRNAFIDKCGQEIGKMQEELKVAKGNLIMMIEMDERNHKIEVDKLEADKDRLAGTILNAGKELIAQDNQIKELKEGLKYILEGNDKYQMEQRCITLLDKYKTI
jgi:hypothetical protein